jgi:hypothetical protein
VTLTMWSHLHPPFVNPGSATEMYTAYIDHSRCVLSVAVWNCVFLLLLSLISSVILTMWSHLQPPFDNPGSATVTYSSIFDNSHTPNVWLFFLHLWQKARSDSHNSWSMWPQLWKFLKIEDFNFSNCCISATICGIATPIHSALDIYLELINPLTACLYLVWFLRNRTDKFFINFSFRPFMHTTEVIWQGKIIILYILINIYQFQVITVCS